MTPKLWGGRFEAEPSELLRRFNDSFAFDRELFAEDVEGSIAWARALGDAGVLSADETQTIIDGLKRVGAAAPGRPAPEAGAATQGEDLLVPIYRAGKSVYDPPPLAEVRGRREEQLARLDAGIKRFENPERYPVELEARLADLKARLVATAREAAA